MTFPSHIYFNDINHGCRAAMLKKSSLWLLPFYVAVVTYCCYKKVHRTMRTAIVSYLHKNLYKKQCAHMRSEPALLGEISLNFTRIPPR